MPPTCSIGPTQARWVLRRREDPFPVVFRRDPAPLAAVTRARSEAAEGIRFGLDNTNIGGVGYQAVSQLLYEGEGAAPGSAIVGFLVIWTGCSSTTSAISSGRFRASSATRR